MQRQEANDIGTNDDDKEDDDGGRPVSFCGSAHGWSIGLVTVTVVMARWSSLLLFLPVDQFPLDTRDTSGRKKQRIRQGRGGNGSR